jgi:hypothetical protein
MMYLSGSMIHTGKHVSLHWTSGNCSQGSLLPLYRFAFHTGRAGFAGRWQRIVGIVCYPGEQEILKTAYIKEALLVLIRNRIQ